MPTPQHVAQAKKLCSRCHMMKRLSYFRPHGRSSDGFTAVCVDCVRAVQKKAEKARPNRPSPVTRQVPTSPQFRRGTRRHIRRSQALWRMYEILSVRGYDGRPHKNPLDTSAPAPIIQFDPDEAFGFSLTRLEYVR